MFESVKQGGHMNAKTYFASLLVSLITHATIFGVIVSLPLIFYSPLSENNPLTWILNSPVLAQEILPPPPPPSYPSGGSNESASPVFVGVNTVPPDKIPDGVPPPDEYPEPVLPNWLARGSQVPGIGLSGRGPVTGNWISELLPDKKPVNLQPPEPPSSPQVIPVASSLQESKLIYRVNPVYSELAIRARVSGTVVLSALVDEMGNVANLRVLSGHPLLVKSAVDAVSQWKYSPTLLNGEPVKVSATVTVVFRIR